MHFVANSSRLLRFSLVLLVAAMAAALTGCDAPSPAAPLADGAVRQVTVLGTGSVQGTPDTLTTNVAISFTAPDVTAAMNQTNERQQAVIDTLVGAGVDRNDIATTGVSLQPQYSGGDVPAIVGYQASNTIDVTIRDIGLASRVLAMIVSTGGDATRINSVNFTIDDDSKLLTDARTRAFEDAKNRAQQYAELSGLQLGEVISISESTDSTTPPTPMPRAAMTDVPLSPGQQSVEFTVTVIWELR